jgi:peptide-methionine (S)-S-oxide reductase
MIPVKLASLRVLLFGLLALSASSLAGTRKTEEATFAAGCFWHVEAAFRKIDGVLEVTSGYTGGTLANPTYEQVCSDKTGHAESIRIEFDPSRVSYDRLLDVFWREHDPTTLNRQGWDVGTQYRSAIFYHSPAQQAAAMASKQRLEKSAKYGKPIVTQIVPAGPFYRAEDYHQRYFEKHPEAELGHADWPAAARSREGSDPGGDARGGGDPAESAEDGRRHGEARRH